jgi:hypothetical protein
MKARAQATNLKRIDVSVWQNHRRVVFIHNDSGNTTHNAGVDVVRIRKLMRKHPKRRGRANGAVHVLVVWLVALRCSHRSKASLEGHFQERDRGERVEGVVILAELLDEFAPSSRILQLLRGGLVRTKAPK